MSCYTSMMDREPSAAQNWFLRPPWMSSPCICNDILHVITVQLLLDTVSSPNTVNFRMMVF